MNPTWNRHSTKVLFFIIFFSLIVFIFAFRLGERKGLMLAFFILAAVYLIAFFLPPRFLEDFFATTRLDGSDAWGINNYLRDVFSPLREKPPQVWTFDSDAVNAFSTIRPFSQPQIFLSRALLENFNENELKAALALLSARIMQQDNFKQTLVSLLRQIIAGLGENGDRFFNTSVLNLIFSPISRLCGRLLFSERNAFRQDDWAAQILGSTIVTAETLRKLYASSLSRPLRVPLGYEQDFVVTPDPLIKNYLPLSVSVEKRLVHLLGVDPT